MSAVARWAFASGRRLLLVLVALLALVLIVLGRFGLDDTPGAPSASAPTATAPRATTSAPTPSPARTAGPEERAAASAGARAYMEAFFADAPSEESAWRAAYSAHATPALSALNEDVPRRVVPRARVLDVEVTGIKPGYAEAEARLSGGLRVHLSLIETAGQWLVDEIAPENPNGAPGEGA